MLKKLLASALAVATVATCAYVPTALASAATTTKTKTATAGEYQAYKLLNPDAKTETKTVTVYLISNGTSDQDTITVDADKNNEAGVQAAIEANNAGKFAHLDGKDYTDGTIKKNEITSVTAVSDTSYLVSYTVKTRYEISTSSKIKTYQDADAVAADDNVDFLGYYVTAAEAYADVLKNSSYEASLKYANKKFTQWNTSVTGLIYPEFDTIEVATAGYTALKAYNLASAFNNANTDALGAQLSATTLLNGSYYAVTGVKRTIGGGSPVTLYVPTNEEASWGTYIYNYLVEANLTGGLKYVNHTGVAEKDTKYIPNGVAILNDNGTKVAVVTYAEKEDEATPATKNVKYTLTITGDVTGSLEASVVGTSVTTVPEDIYTILKGSDTYKDVLTKDTLAEYVAGADVDNKYYVTTVPTETVVTETNTTDPTTTYSAEVAVTVKVEKAIKTTVYYYDENGTIATTSAYLTATQKTDMTKVTAANLGIADTTAVEGYTATFKSAALNKNDVEVTYTLATIDLSNFATATGSFDDKAYFGKKGAVAGRDVMLKVALSETGVANGLDVSKITVTYQLISEDGSLTVKTVDPNWTPVDENDTRPAGYATYITLAKGTNIAIATVSYDGEEVGTFAPFYAFVG
jgi:hypothetical protein